MSFILRSVKLSNLQNWIKTNAIASLRRTPEESWTAYLQANGGSGKTIHDIEATFLTAQLATGSTNKEKWRSYLASSQGSKASEKARDKYK